MNNSAVVFSPWPVAVCCLQTVDTDWEAASKPFSKSVHTESILHLMKRERKLEFSVSWRNNSVRRWKQKREETSLCCWVGLGNNHDFFLGQLERETLTKKYLNLKPVKNYFNKNRTCIYCICVFHCKWRTIIMQNTLQLQQLKLHSFDKPNVFKLSSVPLFLLRF